MKKITQLLLVTVLAASAVLGFGVHTARASCSIETEGGYPPRIDSMGVSLDGAQNNLTVSYQIDAGGGCDGGLNQIVYEVDITSTITGTGLGASTPLSGTGRGLNLTGTQNIGVSSLANGTYTVVMNVSNNFPPAASQSRTFTINNRVAPTATLSASPNPVSSGNPTTLSWTSNNTTECHATGGAGFATGGATSGNDASSALSSQTTFSMQCTGPGGTVNRSVTVSISAGTPPPTVNLTATPDPVNSGQTTTLSWSSTNATSCTATAGSGFATGGATSGSDASDPLTVSTTFSVSCTGPGGSASDSETVVVNGTPPTCYANPNPVNTGSVTAINASGGNGSYSFSAPGGTPGSGTSNPFGVSFSSAGTKTITVTSDGQQGTCTVVVEVPPDDPPAGSPVCSGPTGLGLSQSGTFSVSGGTAPYSWSASGSSNPNGSGTSFTTSWATIGTKVVNVSGGGTDTCSVCVGGAMSCDPPQPEQHVYYDCEPENQTVAIGSPVTLTGSKSPADGMGTFGWTADIYGTDGNPRTASTQNFTTTFSTAGTKVIRLTNSGPGGSFVTFHADDCNVIVQQTALSCSPAVQSAYLNTNATVYASGGSGSYAWTGGGTPSTGAGSPFITQYGTTGAKTVTVTSGTGNTSCTINVISPPEELTCAPTTQSIVPGGTANFSGSGGSGGPYNWSAPGGSPSSGIGGFFSSVFNTAGTYYVTVSESAAN